MRPVLYATLAALLLILAAIGVMEARGFREDYETAERQRMQDLLDDSLEAWESDVEAQIAELKDRLVDGRDRASLLQVKRQTGSWLDAFYLWENGELVFPAEAAKEDTMALHGQPCIADAGAPDEKGAAKLSNLDISRRYMSCVVGVDPASAFATSEAIHRLTLADEPRLAMGLARNASPIMLLKLDSSSRFDVSPYRVLSLRLQYFDILQSLGDPVHAENVLSQSFGEMLVQEGPVLDQVAQFYDYPIKTLLFDGSTERASLEGDEVWQRALRRLDAWRTLRDRTWTKEQLAALQHDPQLEVDPNGDPPWLLYEMALGSPGNVAALQIDQDALVRSFVQRFGKAWRRNISVRDANGRVVFGGQGPLLVHRNFSRVLPTDLQVGFTENALPTSAQDKALLAQMALITVGLIIGAGALLGMVRSDREIVQLLEQQREFMTRVTHELKTPLAGIRLMAENLEFGTYSTPEEIEGCATRIITEADRLHARVDEVLKAARGAVEQEPRPTDVGALLRDLGDQWGPRIEQVGGTLTVEAPATLVAVVMPGLLRDALTNLFDNALKYRREDRPLRVHASLKYDRRTLLFEVSDNGMGVPRDLRTAVFERFRRVEGPGRGKSGGHGLGLAFVADAARAHRGKVECRDGLEGGARFVFRIPHLTPPRPPPPRS